MDLEPYIDEQGLQGPFAENPLYNPLPGGGMDIQQAGGGMDSLQAGGEALEQAVQQLDNLAGQMDVQQPAGGSMDSQQAGEALESLSGQSMPDSHAVSEEIQQATGSRQSLADEEVGEFLDPKTHPPDVPARGEKPTLTDRARGYAGRRYAQFFPGTQPAGDDDRRGILERNLRYFLPLVACLYDAAGATRRTGTNGRARPVKPARDAEHAGHRHAVVADGRRGPARGRGGQYPWRCCQDRHGGQYSSGFARRRDIDAPISNPTLRRIRTISGPNPKN